jgi:DnaJ like chaperone protein
MDDAGASGGGAGERSGLKGTIRRALARIGVGRRSPARGGRHSANFTIALVSLAAKMAKADGIASRIESEVFAHLYKAPAEEAQRVRQVYDRAKADVAGFEAYAERMAALTEGDVGLRRDVLEGLFVIAAADGIFHGDEEAYLQEVARRFGFHEAEYRAIRALFVIDDDDPYVVLGISPTASDAEIRRRHRELVRANHPDTIVARGVPPEFIDIADRKLAAINAAYDRIRRERGR